MRRRAVLSLLLALALLLAGCGSGSAGGMGDAEQSSALEEGDPVPPDDGSASEPEPDDEADAPVNAALARIAGLEELPIECVMGVKHYGGEMGWVEANAVANLERAAVESGDYFLIVPRYAGSRVTVEPLRFEDGSLVPDKPTYELSECPDDYALIVNSSMPEASPAMQVTVSHGGVSASYRFAYDGRGDTDYPVVENGYYLIDAATAAGAPAELGYQIVSGSFDADIDYGHAGFGYTVSYSAMAPADWKHVGVDDGEIDRFETEDLRIDVWGFLDTESNYHHVTHFLDALGFEDTLTLPTGDGDKVVHRAPNADGHLYYSFELEDGLCVMVVFAHKPGTPRPSERAADCNAIMYRIRNSIEVEKVWNGNFYER